VCNQSARECDALLLSSRKLVRLGLHSVLEADALQHLANTKIGLALWNASRIETEH
jgi:hypothetical protein